MGESLGLAPGELTERDGRQLKSENKVHTHKYKEQPMLGLESHNVWVRLQLLWLETEGGQITNAQRKEYRKIDKVITSSMKAAEKILPPQKSTGGHSTALKVILKRIKYLRLLAKHARGIKINDDVLRKLQTGSGEQASGDLLEIQRWTRKALLDLRRYQKEIEEQRQKHLEDLLTLALRKNIEEREKAIQTIRDQAKSRQQYC